MSREREEIKEREKEGIRKHEIYGKKTEELNAGWKDASVRGVCREWFEKTLLTWFDERGRRCRSQYGAHEEQAYIDILQEHLLPEFLDEDYVKLFLQIQDTQSIPAYIVVLTRDILSRKLYLDRNAESVKDMLDWCAKQVIGHPKNGLLFPNGQEESKSGILFFAESIVLTGEIRERETISEAEKSILLLAGNELIGRCVRSGMLVKEMAQEYIDYAMSYGDRSILPALIALKYKEEV